MPVSGSGSRRAAVCAHPLVPKMIFEHEAKPTRVGRVHEDAEPKVRAMVQSVTDRIEKYLGKNVQLPTLGRVTLPQPDTLIFFFGIGALAVLELVEWPIALILGAGSLLADRQTRRLIRGLAEALEEALRPRVRAS